MLPVLLLKLCRKSRGRQINAVGFAQVVKESSSAKEVVSGHKWPGKIFFCELAASGKVVETFLSHFLLLWHTEQAREKEKKEEKRKKKGVQQSSFCYLRRRCYRRAAGAGQLISQGSLPGRKELLPSASSMPGIWKCEQGP